jgi:hypothetical protein
VYVRRGWLYDCFGYCNSPLNNKIPIIISPLFFPIFFKSLCQLCDCCSWLLLVYALFCFCFLTIWGLSCGKREYGNDSPVRVLESLVVNISTSGFNTSSVEGKINNSVVYGLLQCRGDLNSFTQKFVHSPQHFAKEVVKAVYSPSKLIYSLAQCWRDLSQTSYQFFLAVGQSNITTSVINQSSTCQNGTLGAQFHTMGCYFHYEI